MTVKTFIDNQKDLDEFCSRITKVKNFGLDTEFTRTNTFFPIPSVLQISTEDELVAIDLLADLDLKKLESIFSKKTSTLIIHAFRQDIEILKQIFKKHSFNFFDTQIAELFLGEDEPPSYGKMVSKYLNIDIKKSLQYSNWSKRPLDPDQIEYAYIDVEHLLHIFEEQKKSLSSSKKQKMFDEEMKTQTDNLSGDISESDASKFYGYINSAEDLYIVEFLCNQRLDAAIKRNKPKSRILNDKDITNLIFSIRKDKESRTELLEKINNETNNTFDLKKYGEKLKNIKGHMNKVRNLRT